MKTAESKKDIPKFIEFFKDCVIVDEFKEPVEYDKIFNEFFIRELKPGVRRIAYEDIDSVAVCAADSRLMAFNSPDDATRFWIKGQKFSVTGLLGEHVAKDFEGGPMVIYRLAPQDYHRFHAPVSGKMIKVVNILGYLYTVNPIAVNSKYCNVSQTISGLFTLLTPVTLARWQWWQLGPPWLVPSTCSRRKVTQ